ncbi:hypothetical protein [Amycolatopsis sp. NPDC098790]|uniref:hypothetical protein n=1 Tax=Amycolatopsis sp. NPDC098790 TaxID=3363939 RepID=UPI00380A22D9
MTTDFVDRNRLCPQARPIRVAELLSPTVLILAGRGPVTALAGTRVTAHPGDPQPAAVHP